MTFHNLGGTHAVDIINEEIRTVSVKLFCKFCDLGRGWEELAHPEVIRHTCLREDGP